MDSKILSYLKYGYGISREFERLYLSRKLASDMQACDFRHRCLLFMVHQTSYKTFII